MIKTTLNSMKLARKTAASGVHAGATIAVRASRMGKAVFAPTRESAREAAMMVEEKFAAACEGAVAAQKVWIDFAFKAAFGGFLTPDDASNVFVKATDAALAPARRRVKANARRLTGPAG
jgi:hypothetical protein